jgi:tRNA uridine 5-carbamoylmethylation protein Kti12
MVLYNVTVNIDNDVEQEWLQWMKDVHIPDVMATGQFIENKVYKLLHESEDNSTNYSVQYFANSLDDVIHYQQNFSQKLQEDVQRKFKDRFMVFRSVMELV